MLFSLAASIDLLQRTPLMLSTLLTGLPAEWIHANEGGETWSSYQVVGHLLHGEKTDWLPRLRIMLSNSTDKTFEPFDRFAMLQWDQSIPLAKLLHDFSELRAQNLAELQKCNLKQDDLQRTATHPVLGTVTLSNLLASWVVHDLSHLAQISRVLAFQYKEAVGPWEAFMGIYKK